MRKLYTTAVAIALIAGTAAAQENCAPAVATKKTQAEGHQQAKDPLHGAARGPSIWTDDFSIPSNWVINHYGTFNLDWQVGVGLTNQGGFPTPAIQSTTAANGYAMVDSDNGNNSSTVYESSCLTTANPIDLSAFPNVILEFQNQYRKYTDEQCYVEISTNNTDWLTTLDPTTDISLYPNIFYVWQPDGELIQGVSPGNPTTKRINISAVAGSQPEVWVRFHWTGIYGYSWFVDDVNIQEQPPYEMTMQDGFLSNTGNGEEHCRIPQSEMPASMRCGGNAINQGVNAMTNVKLAMLVRDASNTVVFGDSVTVASLAAGDTLVMDQMVTVPALAEGIYYATFTTSADETGSETFTDNNVFLRNFEVTNLRFGLDGVDNHPAGYENYASTGTNQFTGAADDLIAFTYYPIATTETVYGIEFLTTASSVEGGTAIVSIHDTTNILADDPTQPLVESQDHVLSAYEIGQGRAMVYFDSPFSLDPGGYYAAVRMFSNSNTNDWRILDDLAVPQPSLSSAIFIPGDQTYTNGNAHCIRLGLDVSIGVQEHTELTGVRVYPNPSEGVITVNAKEAGNYTVEFMDAIGRIVRTDRMSTSGTFDLSYLGKGAYTARISNEKASAVYSVVLQ